GVGELAIEPGDQVAARDVANEQEQAVGGLVQATVAKPVARQRAVGQVIGLGAGARAFLVSAGFEMPVARELWAGRAVLQALVDRPKGRPAVARHVAGRDRVRDPLETE